VRQTEESWEASGACRPVSAFLAKGSNSISQVACRAHSERISTSDKLREEDVFRHLSTGFESIFIDVLDPTVKKTLTGRTDLAREASPWLVQKATCSPLAFTLGQHNNPPLERFFRRSMVVLLTLRGSVLTCRLKTCSLYTLITNSIPPDPLAPAQSHPL